MEPRPRGATPRLRARPPSVANRDRETNGNRIREELDARLLFQAPTADGAEDNTSLRWHWYCILNLDMRNCDVLRAVGEFEPQA